MSSFVTAYDNSTGYDALITAVFGSDKVIHFEMRDYSASTLSWPHPASLMMFLMPYGDSYINYAFAIKRNIIYCDLCCMLIAENVIIQ